MQTYKLDGHTFTAENCIDGVLINPALSDEFDDTPHDDRPGSELRMWWGRAYIVTTSGAAWDREDAETRAGNAGRSRESREEIREENRPKWIPTWPGGTRYETRCLDGGASDGPTNWGTFATLALALQCAKVGSRHHRS